MPRDTTKLEVREPQAIEIPAIATLFHTSWHDTYDTLTPHVPNAYNLQECIEKWHSYFQDQNNFMLIATVNDQLAGVLYAGPIEEKDAKEYSGYNGQIKKLYILPDMQRSGIGSALLKAGFTQLHQLGLHKIVIRSVANNTKANSFYEKHGGKLIAQPLGSFDIPMHVYEFTL